MPVKCVTRHLVITLNNLEKALGHLDLVLLCETFLHEKSKVVVPGYKYYGHVRSKGKSRGGVCILIRDNLTYIECPDLEVFVEGQFETCFVELRSKQRPIIIGSMYKVPGTSEREFLKLYGDLMKCLKSEKKELVFGIDQNIDYLKVNANQIASEFLDINLSSNLLPCITKPTRITKTSATLIDNIYVSGILS